MRKTNPYMTRYRRFLPGLLAIALVQTTHGANLWEGEEVREGAGFPFITKFVAAEPDAPLVVFIPGGRSMARIAYGGHEGGLEEDFLAYWLNEAGYNFLGISYPLLTASGAFDEPHPDFTVRAWGYGAAEVTRDVMREQGLTGSVIVAVWSMAGKSVQPFTEAAAELGIDHDFHISLASTPPLPTDRTMNVRVSMHESGLIDISRVFELGERGAGSVALQANAADNGRDVIIPTDVLASEYLGHQPVQLLGSGIRYDENLNSFYRDHDEDAQDTKFYSVNYPLVGMLVPGQRDPVHAMRDHATWGYLNANTILYQFAGGAAGVQALPDRQYRRLRELTRQAHSDLLIDMGGNHFFFVGEKGAQATADAIQELERRVHNLKAELREAAVVSGVPANIAAMTLAAAPGMTITGGELSTGGGQYEVSGNTANGDEIELDLVRVNGAWTVQEIQRDVSWASVPQAVRATAAAAPNSFEPVRVIESTQTVDGSVVFELFRAQANGSPRRGPAMEVRWYEGSAEILP